MAILTMMKTMVMINCTTANTTMAMGMTRNLEINRNPPRSTGTHMGEEPLVNK